MPSASAWVWKCVSVPTHHSSLPLEISTDVSIVQVWQRRVQHEGRRCLSFMQALPMPGLSALYEEVKVDEASRGRAEFKLCERSQPRCGYKRIRPTLQSLPRTHDDAQSIRASQHLSAFIRVNEMANAAHTAPSGPALVFLKRLAVDPQISTASDLSRSCHSSCRPTPPGHSCGSCRTVNSQRRTRAYSYVLRTPRMTCPFAIRYSVHTPSISSLAQSSPSLFIFAYLV